MVRVAASGSRYSLGFGLVERTLDTASKAADGYPPYNVERIAASGGAPEILRVTLAVAGFAPDEIEVTQDENQLLIRGRQRESGGRDYIHRGIAARQFQRGFLLAEGMQVLGAEITYGLLSIDVSRPAPERVTRKISISARD